MKEYQKSNKIRNGFANFELMHNLPSLQKLLQELEEQDQFTNKFLKINYSTKQSSARFSTQTQNKTITTLSYDKSKDALIKQTVISKKTTTFFSDELRYHNHFDDQPPSNLSEDDEQIVIDKIKQVVKMLKDYCKYKGMTIPSQITIQILQQNFKIYSCMFYTIYTQFRLLPIYCCSLDKLDEIIAKQYCKSRLNDIILKQFREILKQIIYSNDILRELFELLKNPDFPLQKFNNKHKITFLMMFEQAISKAKKKKNNKKKKRKNRCQNEDDKQHQQEEEDKIFENEEDKLMTLINNLNNDVFYYPTPTSPQFINLITTKFRRLIQI